MGTVGIGKTFIKYVSLNVLGMIGLSCYILADTFFIANGMGETGLASLNLAIPIYSIISGIGLMIGIGGATRYSIVKAQKEDQVADAVFTHSFVLGLIIGVLFVLIGITKSRELSILLGANDATIEMTDIYLRVILMFAPAYIINNVVLAFIRNDNNPNLAMAGMLAGSLSNIVLDYILIYPLNMGMFGAALATGIAPVISMALLSFHFKGKRNSIRLMKCRLEINHFTRIVSLGLSAFITEVSSGVVLIVFNIVILGLVGTTGVAAYGIVANLALVIVAIFTGVAQGIQPMVSHYYGMRESQTTNKILRYSFSLVLTLSVSIYFATFLASDQLVAIFNKDHSPLLADYAKAGLIVYFIGFLFAGFNIVTIAYFSAIEKPMFAFVVSLLRGFILLIPLVLVMANIFGMYGVWSSFVFTEAITSFLILSKLLKKQNPA